MRDSCVGSLLSRRVFFFLYHFFSRHVRKFGLGTKANRIGPLRAPPTTRSVYFARFTDCLHVIALSKRFSRACPFDAFFAFSFSENSTAARRPRNQIDHPLPPPPPPPSILRYFVRPFAHFIPHSELRNTDDHARVKMLS